jgi:uncharacterized protein (TIGR03083 family)
VRGDGSDHLVERRGAEELVRRSWFSDDVAPPGLPVASEHDAVAPTTVVSQIERALEMTARIASRITDTQWSAPTPCADWNVRDVLNHTVGGMRIFTAELTNEDPGADHEADWLGDDPRGRFAAAARADRSALGQDGRAGENRDDLCGVAARAVGGRCPPHRDPCARR